MDTLMTFAEISKRLRKEKGLTQIQLAEALNISKACISMIEIGKNEPTANTLIRYANFFGCTTDYLLGRSDEFGNVTLVDSQSELTQQESRILANYKALSPVFKTYAEAYLQNLSDATALENILKQK